jgi:hypothetical protein
VAREARLFFVEGEDAVEAATAEPVELLRAGVDVDERLLAEVSTPHTAARGRRLPPRLAAAWERGRRRSRSGASRIPGTSARSSARTGSAARRAVEGCADPTSPKGCGRRRLDLARAASGRERRG